VKTSSIYRLAEAAYDLHTAVERALHATLDELDLTLPLADALWQLDPAFGPVSRRQLAERLQCDPSNVTFVVDRLEQRGLVERAFAAGDRRVRAIVLTEPGVDARNRLLATIAESPMFAGLTEAQRRQLLDLLGHCLRHGSVRP
jgi:MarR family transcriptional regulator, organic hydroperoxide resistance regulator